MNGGYRNKSDREVMTGAGKILIFTAAAVLFFTCAETARAVILHPAAEPNLADWTDRPDSNVVGRWGSIASFVAIGPHWLLTTRHQNTFPATVTIAGVPYACRYEPQWAGGPLGDADIQVVRVTAIDGSEADLQHYAEPYSKRDEFRKDVVIGGYGDGRGAVLDTNGVVYGYDWQDSANTTLRFGTNRIEGTIDDVFDGLTSDVIHGDFDGLGEGQSTAYESTIAAHDSGGGWFINDGGQWKVAGLSRGVELHFAQGHDGDPNYIVFEAWFRDRADPNVRSADHLDAVRVSSYADWIADAIAVEGDVTGDEWADFADYAVLCRNLGRTDCNEANGWCEGTDFEPRDGTVDYGDLVFLLGRWLSGWRY